jgi:hypothetical protein
LVAVRPWKAIAHPASAYRTVHTTEKTGPGGVEGPEDALLPKTFVLGMLDANPIATVTMATPTNKSATAHVGHFGALGHDITISLLSATYISVTPFPRLLLFPCPRASINALLRGVLAREAVFMCTYAYILGD